MDASACSSLATICDGDSCVLPENMYNRILNNMISSFLTIMMALVMFAMGCDVDIMKLSANIRRPWGILVGFLSQFGIMPLTGFILSVAFNILPIQAIAVLIMGCCPGGSASNILTYWTEGDIDLSVSMTICSTLLALGMMPLCIYIYTKMWTDTGAIKVPFDKLGISLVGIIIPVALGMLVKRKWPKQAKIILKIGSITGVILIVVIAVTGGILYQGSWNIDPKLWIIGTLFPFIGYLFGFILAWIAGQSWQRCRTVSLETGMQNSNLCSMIIQLSFTPEELEKMFTFPLIYSIFQLTMGGMFVGIYILYKKFSGKTKAEFEENDPNKIESEPNYIRNEGFSLQED